MKVLEFRMDGMGFGFEDLEIWRVGFGICRVDVWRVGFVLG